MWDTMTQLLGLAARELAPVLAEEAGRRVGGEVGAELARKAAEAMVRPEG